MWSRVADTKFIRDGRKFNLREGSFPALAGHLIRADPPGPRPGTILAPLPCPRCPSWHRHTNLSIVAALWCPTRGQWCLVCCRTLFALVLPSYMQLEMMRVFAYFEAAPRVPAVVVFMWMFSFPSLSLRDTLQQRPDPAWGRTPPICLYLGASHLQADNFRRMEILIYL